MTINRGYPKESAVKGLLPLKAVVAENRFFCTCSVRGTKLLVCQYILPLKTGHPGVVLVAVDLDVSSDQYDFQSMIKLICINGKLTDGPCMKQVLPYFTFPY